MIPEKRLSLISKELPLKPEPNTEVPEAIREDNNRVKVML